MKKYFVCFLLLFLTLKAQSIDQDAQDRSQDPLKILQKIVEKELPPALYVWNQDREASDQARLSEANRAIQNDSMLFSLPVELEILHEAILTQLDPRTFQGVRLTCHYFYALSSLSRFYLNDYCLTETRPNNIPIPLLRFKTCNMQDGIFLLAALISVSAENLASWFDQNFLQSTFLPYQDKLPQQLNKQSEETLKTLYPILKVALASGLVNTDNKEDPVMKLLLEHDNPYDLSLNQKRIFSLRPKPYSHYYYETLLRMTSDLHDAPQAIYAIIKELLMAGQNVVYVNHDFFVYDPQKREVAIQILELCVDNPQFYTDHDKANAPLVQGAFDLGRPDLARKVLNKVISWQSRPRFNDPAFYYKFLVFSCCKYREIGDDTIQASIRQFADSLYPNMWTPWLPVGQKIGILELLIQIERWEKVHGAIEDLFLNHWEAIRKYAKLSSLLSNYLKSRWKSFYSSTIS